MIPFLVAVRVGDVGRRAVRRHDDPVGLLDVLGRERHLSVGRDPEDAFEIDLAGLLSLVARIGEVNVPLGVDGEVVGAVESFPLPFVRKSPPCAVQVHDRDPPAAARVRAFADHEAALSVEFHAVGAAARVAEDRRPVRLRIEVHDAVPDVAQPERYIQMSTEDNQGKAQDVADLAKRLMR